MDDSFVLSARLQAEAEAVTNRRELLVFTERALFLLSDHHAITGSSLNDSYAVIPSFSDMWIEFEEGRYIVTQVRAASPAQEAGIEASDILTRIGDEPINSAVANFWTDLGETGDDQRNGFAARILAAGRRDSSRSMTIARDGMGERSVSLASLYSRERTDQRVKLIKNDVEGAVIRIEDSLGDSAAIEEFDAIMASIEAEQKVTLDLRNTPGGGNTIVARAIMGWFVNEPSPDRSHSLPGEMRSTGIARQWTEYVLPREGKRHDGQVEVRVGRWTCSMGEGLAVGFDALGACVWGDPMAGLLGAIYDYRLKNSGLVVKVPTERLSHIDGTARENYFPALTAEQCSGAVE
ncbi:hypothetical protein GCM10023115_13570 [Pontixanthobacter gangjinensis]|uniref:Peptidase S41 n=1 Tax=Pontixanthobacter gangjinensis TaxID=1028742 RepID=A0A6I4SL37_9SPHN|nr:S41 family peptidase [Pontixanthobacter gangjinensis]MXO56601.1 peptidase S41 [Pontixanthobacter gangjinensis]